MQLVDLLAVLDSVAATRARSAKVALLADLLGALPADEVIPAVGLLLAAPRQGRLGIGWRSLAALEPVHAGTPSLSIREVDDVFSALAATAGAGSVGRRADLLRALAARATAPEWHLLSRVLLGELRTGAVEGVLGEAIARAADRDPAAVRRATMLTGDVAETARLALAEDPDALASVGLEVGRPVFPMLAGTAASVAEALSLVGEASVEFKLDGARIQVHRRGDEVHVYTRSLAEVTARVPEIVAVVRELPVREVILDGETLALDDAGAPRAFQDTMARFGAETASQIALRPWFFDVLHVDGRDFLDEPLAMRQRELERVAATWRIPWLHTADASQAEAFSLAALDAGHEGAMVKDLAAPYAAGRRGKTWLKVKPVHTLDLVVLAVEQGSGRRSQWLSNLHLGALDPTGRFGEPGGFVMVGKTFKGLTDDVLRWQTEHFPRIQTDRRAHTLFVEPVTVVEIAIDGVQRSPRYPGGVTLRFARVKGYRPGKRPEDADTIDRLRGMLRG